MEEDLKIYRDEITNLENEFQKSLENRQKQIAELREKRNEIETALLENGYSYTDLYMNEEVININSQMEKLNQLGEKEAAEILKKTEEMSTKLEKLTEISKKVEARETELENQGIRYGEIALDEEIQKLRAEFSELTGNKEILKKAQQEKEAKEKYNKLQEKKTKLEEKISKNSRNKLFDEREERIGAIKELASKGKKIDDPEYNEYMNDIQKINKELEKIDKEIADDKQELKEINKEIEELEKQYGKDFFIGKEKNEEEKIDQNTNKNDKKVENEKAEKVIVTETHNKENTVPEAAQNTINDEQKASTIETNKENNANRQVKNQNTNTYRASNKATEKDVSEILNENEAREEKNLENDMRHKILTDGLLLDKISIDVSRAVAAVSFSNGITKEVNLDEVLENSNPKQLAKELRKKGIKCSGKMDPYMINSIDKAIEKIFKENKIENKLIQMQMRSKIVRNYEHSIDDLSATENSYRPVHITYMKMFAENMEEKHNEFEKGLKPYIRYAKNSEYVNVAENIDSRNWFEKLTDKVKSLFNPTNTLPSGEKNSKDYTNSSNSFEKSEESKEEKFINALNKNVPSMEEQAKKAEKIRNEMNKNARDVGSIEAYKLPNIEKNNEDR